MLAVLSGPPTPLLTSILADYLFHQEPGITLYCGDALTVLRELPDASVQTCITSPPYWGLRDYGTAAWEGGDEACDHLGPPKATQAGFNRRYFGRDNVTADKQSEVREPFRAVCGKCGARRVDAQLGLEPTPEAYVAALVEVFREVRRVLREDGTLWINLGDSYTSTSGSGRCAKPQHTRGVATWDGAVRGIASGLKPKDLVGIPWRVAFALQADGWWLRSDIIWAKPNPIPESVTDRPTKSHEYLFLLAKSERYYYDAEAIKEPAQDWGERDRTNWKARDPRHNTSKPHTGGTNGDYSTAGRNRRSVWTVATQPFPEAHFATFPPDLIKPCVLAGSRVGDTVLDPFAGAGTTLYVAKELNRASVGIELNADYCTLAVQRLRQEVLPL